MASQGWWEDDRAVLMEAQPVTGRRNLGGVVGRPFVGGHAWTSLQLLCWDFWGFIPL